ncbi:hypothetical protein FRB96_009615 [Tulasnella sp. 330]|nr:hypothetical protein FRB96_009615 [Tulasnella sp. 330]
MSELLSIGQTCAHPPCATVDFLPIKCQHCAQPYCSEHWKPELHSCTKWDSSAHDRIAPACPFCQTPVAFAPGVDPNLAMEDHFEKKCDVVRGGGLVGVNGSGAVKRRDESPRCARKSCKKILIAPITCQTCSQQFCAEHRFPASHTCNTAAASSPSRTPQSSSYVPSLGQGPSNVRSAAAVAAMSRAVNSVKPASAQQSTASSTSSSPTKPKPQPKPSAASSSSGPSLVNPFSKTERWDPSSKSIVNHTAHSRSIMSSASISISLPTSSNNSKTTTTTSSSSSSSSSSTANQSSSSTTSGSGSDPAQLTKPRSRAEEESQKKALKERAKKGLLTEADKARLVQLNTKGEGKDDNCIIV